MATERSDGGPAFPTEPNTQPGFYVHHGMSLRDWFAGQAVVAIAADVLKSDVKRPEEFDTLQDWVATMSYELADAMLAAREGK